MDSVFDAGRRGSRIHCRLPAGVFHGDGTSGLKSSGQWSVASRPFLGGCALALLATDHWQLTTALRRFDQLHLAIASAMQNHQLAFGIAEDEHVPIVKVGFFDGFFQRHRAHRHSFIGTDDVNFG
jgi:hypothetical protein